LARFRVINRAASDNLAFVTHRFHHNYLLGVAENREIRIVGHHDRLPSLFGVAKHRDNRHQKPRNGR
jgi:hypothetical protein